MNFELIFEIFVNFELIFEIFVNFGHTFEFSLNFEVFLSMADEVTHYKAKISSDSFGILN